MNDGSSKNILSFISTARSSCSDDVPLYLHLGTFSTFSDFHSFHVTAERTHVPRRPFLKVKKIVHFTGIIGNEGGKVFQAD